MLSYKDHEATNILSLVLIVTDSLLYKENGSTAAIKLSKNYINPFHFPVTVNLLSEGTFV